jgi:hypothetical protein
MFHFKFNNLSVKFLLFKIPFILAFRSTAPTVNGGLISYTVLGKCYSKNGQAKEKHYTPTLILKSESIKCFYFSAAETVH